MLSGRLRLASLWLVQVGRVAADVALLALLLPWLSNEGIGWAFLYLTPGLLLAPFIGIVCDGRGARWALIGGTGLAALAVPFLLSEPGWCLTIVGAGAGLASAARRASLADARQPLSRANGLLEMGRCSAIAAGLRAGLLLEPAWQPFVKPLLYQVVLIANGVALVGVLLFRACDATQGKPGTNEKRIFASPATCASLLPLAGLRGVGLLMIGLGIDALAAKNSIPFDGVVALALGGAAGSLIAGLQGHRRRVLGFVPLGGTVLVIGLIVVALGQVAGWLLFVIGGAAGVVHVALLTSYEAGLPTDSRGMGFAVLNGLAALFAGLIYILGLSLWALAAITLVAVVIAWRVLIRDAVEQIVELITLPFYRVHVHGPGLEQVPLEGPLIVIANHSAWFDPIWLAKVLPRRLVPMLTSVFYDIPVLRTLVKVAGTIRVEYSRFRKEAPELEQAVAVLDRGQALLIFPEGQMRKLEDVPLRPFGRGVWRILQERPETPVLVCWIEGGWGSFASYYKGKPTKNKRVDLLRRIDVAVSPPRVLEPEVLADHRATRTRLAQDCLDARKHLNLEPLAMPGLFGAHDDPEHDDEQESAATSP